MSDKSSFHSPAQGLTEGFDVGGGSAAPAPSWHPDPRLTEKSGMPDAPGTSAAPEFGGVGPSAGAITGVQLVDAPQSYSPGEGDSMVGGLGTPPRP